MNGVLAHLRNLAVIGVLMATAACGGTTGSSTPATATAAPTPTVAPFIASRTATVAGATKTVLTDLTGNTLYYETNDVGGKILCTAACAVAWPPFIAPAGLTTLPAVSGIPGKFGTAQNPDSKNQVTYNGWPLYGYAKDKAPGDTTGEGVGGRWHVAATDLVAGA
jgi:predicted lipoprotein with Yx(FWY)xxD motif